jgi:hypothetical protein
MGQNSLLGDNSDPGGQSLPLGAKNTAQKTFPDLEILARAASSSKTRGEQGCQIFLGATYQKVINVPNDYKYTKWPLNITIGCKTYQTAVRYNNLSMPRPTKKYPNCIFWFANITSGNPGGEASLVLALFGALIFLCVPADGTIEI